MANGVQHMLAVGDGRGHPRARRRSCSRARCCVDRRRRRRCRFPQKNRYSPSLHPRRTDGQAAVFVETSPIQIARQTSFSPLRAPALFCAPASDESPLTHWGGQTKSHGGISKAWRLQGGLNYWQQNPLTVMEGAGLYDQTMAEML